jgi:hypothetical protein
VSRVAAGGAAFLLAGVLCAIWGGANILYTLTGRHDATVILKQALADPYTSAVKAKAAATKGPEVAEDQDLIKFDLSRQAAESQGVVRLQAEARANELYDAGFPKDPGVGRTQTFLPRAVLNLLTQFHHKNLKTAKTAAAIATGAARFGLPGVGVLLGRVIVTWHIRLVNFWVEKNVPGALTYRGKLRLAATQPLRQLFFVAVALLFAGLFYSALLGGTKVVMSQRADARRERKTARAERKKAKSGEVDAAGPAPSEAPPAESADAPSEVAT